MATPIRAPCRCTIAAAVRAAGRGIKLTPPREYWGDVDTEDNVVLGFGHLSNERMEYA
ncbi:hypothetical protein GWO70_009435 [Corynebacterium macginleyi]|uniref:hypothetical protein n=1 Tax=Corynebacterium macginleyi TaxID=38290 RepID=UPI00193B1639|nr:hypothetical protein [Corynebacterium macginleyi]QRJ61195.1 hypothetical protein GWO70_009435 [Corynebacterium macginleyi]